MLFCLFGSCCFDEILFMSAQYVAYLIIPCWLFIAYAPTLLDVEVCPVKFDSGNSFAARPCGKDKALLSLPVVLDAMVHRLALRDKLLVVLQWLDGDVARSNHYGEKEGV